MHFNFERLILRWKEDASGKKLQPSLFGRNGVKKSQLMQLSGFIEDQHGWIVLFLEKKSAHTFIVQRQHVEPQSAGLLAHVAVNVVRPSLVDGDGVLEGLHAGLQAERVLGVSHRVPGERRQQGSPWERGGHRHHHHHHHHQYCRPHPRHHQHSHDQ